MVTPRKRWRDVTAPMDSGVKPPLYRHNYAGVGCYGCALVRCCDYSAQKRVSKQNAAPLCQQQVSGFHRRCADNVLFRAFMVGVGRNG